ADFEGTPGVSDATAVTSRTGFEPDKPREKAAPTVLADRSRRLLLHARFAPLIATDTKITRSMVSFQANKTTPFYRWFKYREGFSSELVTSLLDRFQPKTQPPWCVLDPFAGAGATLTTSTKAGWEATGIELLPVGTAAIRARFAA